MLSVERSSVKAVLVNSKDLAIDHKKKDFNLEKM